MKDTQHAVMLEKAVYNYCEGHSTALDKVLYELQRETHLKTLAPQMLSGQLLGQLLTNITRMKNVKRALEIGTFTGFSAICIAKGLASDGMLTTLEANPETGHIARKYFQKAGLEDRIDLRYGDALKIIPQLSGPFELVFIDANKREYPDYYKTVVPLVSVGGTILVDNVLWDKKVLDPAGDLDAEAVHSFNESIIKDPRVEVLMLPVRDGFSVITKLSE